MEDFKSMFYMTLGFTTGLGLGIVVVIFVAKVLWN